MKEIKRRIAALGVAGTLVATTAGCGNNNNLRYELNEETKQEELVGKASIYNIKEMDIVEIENNLSGTKKLYLCNETKSYGGVMFATYHISTDYTDLKSSLAIAHYDVSNNEFTSSYGSVKNITSLFDYLLYYDYEIKNEYSAEEINELFEKIKQDYQNSNNNQKVFTKTLGE